MGEITRYAVNSVKKGYNLLRGAQIERLDRRIDRLKHKNELNDKFLKGISVPITTDKSTDPIFSIMGEKAFKQRERYTDHLAKLERQRNFEENKTNLARAGLLGAVGYGTLTGITNSIPQAEIPDYVNPDGSPYYTKTAGNIPKDTSKPTDASPSEAADYYDFHEYLLTEEPHPDRKDLPQLNTKEWANAPQKIAHDLGVDLYTINVIEEELGLRDRMPVKTAATPSAPPKVGRAKPGSTLLGLAIISAAAAATNKNILERGLTHQQEDVRPSYAL
jgi:hypothetical protein